MELRITGYENAAVLKAAAQFITVLADMASAQEGVASNSLQQPAAVTFPVAEAVVTPGVSSDTPGADVKPKRTRKPKEDQPQAEWPIATGAPAPAPAPEPEPLSPEQAAAVDDTAGLEAKPATLDDVRTALQALIQRTSMEDAMALLQQHGASRISELGVDKYKAFIEACK